MAWSFSPQRIVRTLLVVPLIGLAVSAAAIRQHLFDRTGGAIVQPELTGIHAAIVGDGGCFAPDQLRTAAAEPSIAAKREFVRSAVQCAVAAFHRLHAQAVPNDAIADVQRLKEGSEVAVQFQHMAEPQRFRL